MPLRKRASNSTFMAVRQGACLTASEKQVGSTFLLEHIAVRALERGHLTVPSENTFGLAILCCSRVTMGCVHTGGGGGGGDGGEESTIPMVLMVCSVSGN